MARTIMIQGTASGVGKSVLAAALCRIFTQDGFRVAPFKAQNMSSNYHRLANGDRMARSQAIAAYACNAEPSVLMNPILLLPTEPYSTEVVVDGKSWGGMDSLQYGDFKGQAFAKVLEAYSELSADNDIIVIEGAGSPVELNLNKNDMVNMGLAVRLGCPVILVADIIRGGVFAALYGTMALFTEEQRQLVRGMVVNKFRGFTEHFEDGRQLLEQLCAVPVVGVIPYVAVNLEDEDSLVDEGVELRTRQSLVGAMNDAGYREYMDRELDSLAAHFRKSLDMEQIYEIMGAREDG